MSGIRSHNVGFARTLPEWDGAAYAANTAHHRVHDDRFLAPLGLRGDERVLDIGCGSGDFTAKVAELVPNGSVVGVEPQPSMIEQAERAARPNQQFVQAAAQDVGEAFATGTLGSTDFDVVISRATLHWVPEGDQAQVLAGIRSVLRPGGRVRLEMGGAGNVPSVVALLDDISAGIGGPTSPWFFADAGWYLDALQAVGFAVADNDVCTVAQRRPFSREGLQAWFESQAAMAYEVAMSAEQRVEFLTQVDCRFDEMRRDDGTYDLTYVRLEALAHLPG